MTRKWLCALLVCFAVLFAAQPAFAKKPTDKARVLFVPHDNRPISDEQTADAVRQLGWDIEVPPDEMLGSRGVLGKPEDVWDWLEERAKKADIAVLSSDTTSASCWSGSTGSASSKRNIQS